MADAKKCDRCGNFYDRNEKNVMGASYSGRIFHLAGILMFNEYDDGQTKGYDLCDDCGYKLMSFMEGKEDE